MNITLPDAVGDRFQAVEDLLSETRDLVLDSLETGFSEQQKEDKSFVTDIDLRVESHIRGVLQDRYPRDTIIGEELSDETGTGEWTWVIDPIDATHSLRHGVPLYGTLIACLYEEIPLVGGMDFPALRQRYIAGHELGTFCNGHPVTMKPADGTIEHEIISLGEREQFINADRLTVFDTLMREHPHARTYCDCFGHALAIEGAVGAMVDFGLRKWDMAPIRILAEEAGGSYIQLREYQDASGAIRYDVIAGKPSVVQWILTRLESLI